MAWEVEYTDEFFAWWNTLNVFEQRKVGYTVSLLVEQGPNLAFPHSSHVKGSKYHHMRELRTQCGGNPLRTLYAFDRRRVAILLIGGNKVGNDDWYEVFIPLADKIYEEYLKEIEEENRHG